jgi:LuxR family maltose regulon positive regulatory protein
MSIPLLQTKLYRPAPGPGLLPRLRLVEQLEQGRQAHHRLILVCAQAGSGKTTLLSAWLGSVSEKVAWLSLDEADNDPARFWAYVVAALQTALPALGQSLLAALQAPALPPQPGWLIPFLNELNTVAEPLCLLLDDYHVITSPVIHEAVAFLIARLPPSVHLVLATRGDPPWPLGRLRVRQQLTEVRAADLRFTPEETAEFLNRCMGLNLEPEHLAALEERTEGWAAGLQLAALALKTLPAGGTVEPNALIAAFTGSHHFVLDYLAEEVLSRQTPETQRFLLQTSILDRLCGGLCNAVTGQHDGDNHLAQLQRQNLFLVPLDAAGYWYRYHHLFADLLSHRCRHAFASEHFRELHQRASQWLAQNGWLEEAVKHALAAPDFERAASLVEQASKATMLNGQLTTLLRWLEALPDALRRSRPRLRLYEAWVHYLGGHDELAGQMLQESQVVFQALPPTPENSALRGELATLLARSAAFAGDTVRAIEAAEAALTYLPESDQVSRARVASALGIAYSLQGESDKARQAYHTAAQLALATGNTFLAAHTLAMEGTHCFQYGQLQKAAQIYQRAVDLGGGGPPPFYPAGEAYIGLAEIAFEHNHLEVAARHLQLGLDLCQQGGLAGGVILGYLLQARLCQAQGNLSGALAALQAVEARQAKGSSDFGSLQLPVQAVRLRLAAGDLDGAAHWAQRLPLSPTGETTDPRVPVVITEVLLVTLAQMYLALGKVAETLAVLDRLGATAEPAGRNARLIEMYLLQTAALAKQGRGEAALAALQRAVELAEPEGYARVFIDEGEALRGLLADRPWQTAKAMPSWRAYVEKLVGVSPASDLTSGSDQQADVDAAPLIEPLTKRELEVLRWLCAGYSNREMAEKLVVTVNAVKKHTSHIFGKLGVSSRTQAVARARQLGLVVDPPQRQACGSEE